MLNNDYLVAKIGVDAAENELSRSPPRYSEPLTAHVLGMNKMSRSSDIYKKGCAKPPRHARPGTAVNLPRQTLLSKSVICRKSFRTPVPLSVQI